MRFGFRYAEFLVFANKPAFSGFYKELPEKDEDAVERLRKILGIIKHEKIGITVSWLPIFYNTIEIYKLLFIL